MFKLRDGTVGLRFTLLYAAAFLACGAGLLALAGAFSGVEFSSVAPAPGQVPTGDPAEQRIHALEAQITDLKADYARQLLLGSLLALAVMAAVSLLIGRAMARRVLRPLRTITSTTREISADDLDRRLAVTGPDDEVKDLADTIDGLLGRLEASFDAQRRFVANASHELRTPLTTMRALVDVAAAKPDAPSPTVALADRLRPRLDDVDRLLDGLLVLARAQHGALDDVEPVDLAVLADQAVTDRAAAIAAKELSATRELSRGTGVRGDVALLARMVDNLLDNAVVHNDAGGWIRVVTTADAEGEGDVDGNGDGDEVRLVVETGGPVLDQRDVDELALPFRRLGGDRTGSDAGTGLGLSIVASIAAAHGGRLTLTARPQGGLRAEIALPFVRATAEVGV
ncbi:sensor histidine kinase [Promicromonospora panici]|uniref:sensor histidine kinase n=1 Tax=Promicromonospora panici TaxID=2219658 RepID=UPI00101D1AC9|nr:HAMP domain-containing sensor histidine kinase [Promicromonospora panici]